MNRTRKDFYSKVLLMLALAGAVLGVAHAGYDADDRHSDPSLHENNDMAAVHAQALSSDALGSKNGNCGARRAAGEAARDGR
jgi:hypothetical protein